MKKDKKQELRNNTVAQLDQRLEQINTELVKMNLDFSMGKVKNVHALKALKKERAFIKTILTEKQIETSEK
jgi:ribosomal protein L29